MTRLITTSRIIAQIATAFAMVMAAPLNARAVPALHVDPTISDCSVRFASTLTQEAFRRFALEFGSVSAFKQMAPASTLGQWGVSIGVEMMSFPVDEYSAAWNDTFVHPDAQHWLGSRQSFPKLKARLGVTDDIDAGIFYTGNPHANYGWLGLDGKYKLIAQSTDTPITLSVRGAYTKTLYVSDMNMDAVTVDVSLERKFWDIFRPYAGIGSDLIFARETTDAVNLHNENIIAPHVFGGFDVTFWKRFGIGAELTLGSIVSEHVQLSVVF